MLRKRQTPNKVNAIFRFALQATQKKGTSTDLSALPWLEFLERPNVIDKQIHQSQFVAEAHEDVEARGMKGDTLSLLWELTVQLQVTVGKMIKSLW